MSSYVSMLVHYVWSTSGREPLIRRSWQSQLYSYFGGIVRNKKGVLISAGEMADHVHLLLSLPSTITIADAANALKSNSSAWVHANVERGKGFRWQGGYGAFSVSQSMQEQVAQYITAQEEHHRSRTFQEEFVTLLRKHRIDFNEQYLWQ